MTTYGTLFSGVEGFGLGFEREGWGCRFQVEWDPHCAAVLERHWPHVERHRDVRDVNGAELPRVDVVAFGSPCQDLSLAGRRAGLYGTQSGLFFEAIRIIQEARNVGRGPTWAVWENVTGAFSSNGGADFAAAVGAFGDLGAHLIEWAMLDAQFFGVPQRRHRVFLVACFDPATAGRCPDILLPVATGGTRDSGPGRTPRADPAGSGPRGADSAGGQLIAGAIDTRQGGADDSEAQAGHLVPTWWDGSNIAPCLDASVAVKGQMMPDKGRMFAIAEPVAIHVTQDPITGPISPCLGLDATIGVHSPAVGVRRLTPLECERLMGWPDHHTRWRSDGTETATTHRYRICGNGVVAPVAAWIAQQINKVNP